MKQRLLALLAVLVLALTVGFAAGCDDDDDDDGGGGAPSQDLTATPDINVAEDPDIAAAVPDAVKSDGKLTVATDATYPPDEFIAEDGKTIIGMSADLAKALGQVMGLEAEMQNAPFDSIIPGLAANKYDISISSFTDTKEREATVDFVTYLTAGTTFYVASDGGPDIQTLDDLCGHSVAAEKGTTQVDDATEQDKKCTDAGDEGVEVQALPDQNAANLAVTSGRAEVGMADTPVAIDITQRSEGALEVSGDSYNVEPYGIAIPKDNGMAQPTLDAVKVLIDDGTYGKILEYWDLEGGAIDDPVINGAIS